MELDRQKELLDYINNYECNSDKDNFSLGYEIASILCNSVAIEDNDFLIGLKTRIDESL